MAGRSTARKARLALAVLGSVGAMLLSGCAIGFRGPALDVTYNSATLTGDVLSNRSETGYFFFNYGKTASYGQQTPPHPERVVFQAGIRQSVSADLGGLEPATTYHYALCAKDQEPGVSALCSADQTFTTTGDYVRGALGLTSSTGSAIALFNDVRSGPAGQNPLGTFSAYVLSGPGSDLSGPVTCLTVTSDTKFTVGVQGLYFFFDVPVDPAQQGTFSGESMNGGDPSVCPPDPTQGNPAGQAVRISGFTMHDEP